MLKICEENFEESRVGEVLFVSFVGATTDDDDDDDDTASCVVVVVVSMLGRTQSILSRWWLLFVKNYCNSV